jgi:eukaryotic-like serine/threonine-protein kinase
MPTDRWHRIELLFTQALEQPAGTRADFLAHVCGADTGMRDEVTSLLAAREQSGDFLTAPALDVLAQQISRQGWSVQPGDRIACYTVERRLGAGGMGEVWRARDARLGRDVAIKLLLPNPASAAERVQALQREARAAGTLNHTNVLTVYDVGDHCGAPYLVTECLEGESLRARLNGGALPVDAALDVALQVARGLGAAHQRGIVHRDLKPENIFLALDGRVKILDFGLATLHDPTPQALPAKELPTESSRMLIAGTAGYMAPEQVRGQFVDPRADIFALAAVLYEMLAGHRAFKGESTLATLAAVLTEQPPDLAGLNPEISPALSNVVSRCLAKSPDDRFATIAEAESAIESVIQSRNQPVEKLLAFARKPMVMVTVALLIAAMVAGGWQWHVKTSRVRWARNVAAPEIQRLSNHGDYAEAFLLSRQARDIAPDDPHLEQLWRDVSLPASITTDQPGAEVSFTTYRTPTTWLPVGRTPLRGVRIARGLMRIRISKAGFQPVEGSLSPPGVQFHLDPVDAAPPGMVRVVGGRDAARFGQVGDLDDYWIDRLEVTNRQFKEFVDQGGYQRRDLWREPFVEGGRSVPWEEAIRRFRDATGMAGPATWQSATYPDGQADFPVGGVSWYEAAAYAVFAGKNLPTFYHWYRAANLGRFADILTVSNFNEKGPAAVGSYTGLGPFGTYDMAGNVKEWCWNKAHTAAGSGRTHDSNDRRFLLGGSWNEPRYMFADYDARGPFERAPGYGFRLAKYLRPLPGEVTAPVPIDTLLPDAEKRRPVSDLIFAVYRRQYSYDHGPLNAVVEATEEAESWVKQTITFDAAYGGERMRAFLFLPKIGSPPYQTVIFFPAGDALQLPSSRDISIARVEFVIRSGRALLYPVYKGTYERGMPGEMGRREERDLWIAWSRDLGRAIDYLETRPDVDRTRLAFYGISTGAAAGVILCALEPRLKTTVLQGAAMYEAAPEIDPLNYASRVRIPTLMLNGRYDFESPFETAQRPLFNLLGSPAESKKHIVFEKGHALPVEDAARAILPWLDRYLGAVVHLSGEATRNSQPNGSR